MHPQAGGNEGVGRGGLESVSQRKRGAASPAAAGSQQRSPLLGTPSKVPHFQGLSYVRVWERAWSKASHAHPHFDPTPPRSWGHSSQAKPQFPALGHPRVPETLLLFSVGQTSLPTGSPRGRRSRCNHTEQRRSPKTPLRRGGGLGDRPSPRNMEKTFGEGRKQEGNGGGSGRVVRALPSLLGGAGALCGVSCQPRSDSTAPGGAGLSHVGTRQGAFQGASGGVLLQTRLQGEPRAGQRRRVRWGAASTAACSHRQTLNVPAPRLS